MNPGPAHLVLSPHCLQDLLTHSALATLAPSKLQLFHAIFIENPSLTLESCSPLNPATLLPSTEPLTHSCKETLQELSLEDPLISSSPLHDSTLTWFVDGRSILTPSGPAE